MPNNELQIVVFNVAHGACAYVSTPNGRSILIDAGCSDDFSPAERLFTHYGVRQVDLLVISHPHHDHIQDIENVDCLFDVVTLLRNRSIPDYMACPGGTSAPSADQKYLEMHRRFIGDCPAAHRFAPSENWGGVTITAACNQYDDNQWMTPNDLSQVLRLRYGELDILFPGDIEPDAVKVLMRNSDIFFSGRYPAAHRILLAPHHGRDSGTSQEIMDCFHPTLAVLSDKWGSETTNYGFYNSRCLGEYVYSASARTLAQKRAVTTKTNNFVLIASDCSSVDIVTS